MKSDLSSRALQRIVPNVDAGEMRRGSVQMREFNEGKARAAADVESVAI